MKISNIEISKVILEDGKIISFGFIPSPWYIVEAFGQTFRIEEPGTKRVKITQLNLSIS